MEFDDFELSSAFLKYYRNALRELEYSKDTFDHRSNSNNILVLI